jgi:hypothetical protein
MLLFWNTNTINWTNSSVMYQNIQTQWGDWCMGWNVRNGRIVAYFKVHFRRKTNKTEVRIVYSLLRLVTCKSHALLLVQLPSQTILFTDIPYTVQWVYCCYGNVLYFNIVEWQERGSLFGAFATKICKNIIFAMTVCPSVCLSTCSSSRIAEWF